MSNYAKIMMLFVLFAALWTNTGYSRSEYPGDLLIGNDSPAFNGTLSERDTIIDPFIDWPLVYGVQQTGQIEMTFDCHGTFGTGFLDNTGYNLQDGWPVSSFVTPTMPEENRAEYLFAGAIWVGGIVGGDTLVSVGADGWGYIMEMWPPKKPGETSARDAKTVIKFNYPTDYSMAALFHDTVTDAACVSQDDFDNRPHIPLNLRISNRSHVWRSEPHTKTILYDLVITNIGDEYIEQGYTGFYFDCDVSHIAQDWDGAQDDLTGSIQSERIAYIIDNDGDPEAGFYEPDSSVTKLFAFKFLETSFDSPNTNFNWWISNSNAALDFGPRLQGTPEDPFRDFGGNLGTPMGDCNKYYIMSHDEWDYDQIFTARDNTADGWLVPPVNAQQMADGYDTRFLMSIGPFDLPPDSSIRIIYATFTGDSVHNDPDNFDNISVDPELYLAGLDFTDVMSNAALSNLLLDSLINPDNPIEGVRIVHENDDSTVIEWDHWVFNEVNGYDVFLYEIPEDSMPYPGLVPPWLLPENPDLVASLGLEYSYTFDTLNPDRLYAAFVAHHFDGGSGTIDNPAYIGIGQRHPAPQPDMEYLFSEYYGPADLNWTAPPGVDVDHYNIYRFDDSLAADNKYYSFYSEEYHTAMPPKDTFYVNDTYYYYYAMEPYAQVDSQFTTFTENSPTEDMVYVITAVDKYGFESYFSYEVIYHSVEPKTKDILVVTSDRTYYYHYDSVQAFYDSILYDYDYDIYRLNDSIVGGDYESADWHDYLPYRLVIIDYDFMQSDLSQYELYTSSFSKYILSGGKLALFGGLTDFLNYGHAVIDSVYFQYATYYSPFVNRFFGIDSVSYPGLGYFNMYDGSIDSIFAFIRGEGVTGCMPDLVFDTLRNPFRSVFNLVWWPEGTGPSVSTFTVGDRGQTTHLYRSLYPEMSWDEGKPVGVKTDFGNYATYLFGFHLYYMTHENARELVECMLPPPLNIHSIEGDVTYYDQAKKIPNTVIYLGGDTSDTYLTGSDGSYKFDSLFPGDYALLALKTAESPGVSVADCIKIRRHLAYIEQFDSPFKLLAADVNASNMVSVADVIKIRRYLATIDTLTTGNWKFINSSFDIDESNWWEAPGFISLSLTDTDITDSNFIGIRMGDVNNTWSPTKTAKPSSHIAKHISLDNIYGIPGDIIAVPCVIDENTDIAGFELHLKYDPQALTFSNITSDLPSEITINPTDETIHIVWESIEDIVSANKDKPIISLNFLMNEALENSTEIEFTRAEIVDITGEPYDLQLNPGYVIKGNPPNIALIPTEYRLEQNRPNPFNPTTEIRFGLPEASNVCLEIYNIMGQRVRTLVNEQLEAGYHSYSWDAGNYASGVYFTRIKAGVFTATRKMVLLK